jgi:cytoskeleton protein RodZ
MPETEPRTEEDSVGGILSRARHAQDLTVQQVASQMHLDPRIIEALEANDFGRLPAALYVRGYLRGYAKILKIDPAPLIARYDQASPAEAPEIVPEVKYPTQSSSTDRPVRAFTYLVSFTLAIMLIAWWQSNFLLPARFDAAIGPSEEAPPPGLGYPIIIVEHPTSPFYRAPPEEDLQEEKAEAEVSLPAAGQDSVITAGDGPDRVVIRLTADSWIRISDASGQILFENLARAGQELVLTGIAPFSVLLGFSQGATLEFNGEPVDHAAHSRSGVARFTLGG